ncbi:MAG: hypothetical protein ACLPQI_07645 [Steroidobacteraceae bacterium]
MSQSIVFREVTPAVLERLGAAGGGGGYRLEKSADGSRGTLSGETPVGHLWLSFKYEAEHHSLTVTIDRKPFLVPAALVFATISNALREAGATHAPPS